MKQKEIISIAWLRRDLRTEDNRTLFEANSTGNSVLPLFIFDKNILLELEKDDHRVTFIHDNLSKLNREFNKQGGGIYCVSGNPIEVFKDLEEKYEILSVHAARDYEPYAKLRDEGVANYLSTKNIKFKGHKDQVIFEKGEVLKKDGSPYTVFTPYKNQWLELFSKQEIINYSIKKGKLNLLKSTFEFPTLQKIGFSRSEKKVENYQINDLKNYAIERNVPALDHTSKLSPHLRFGTVSIRNIVSQVKDNPVFLGELIWREFFMQILYHFPNVVDHNFREKYDGIKWRNNESEFKLWCEGNTGYPMVDAGMRQLNQSGYMHNRVRMVVASFLCKHLLIDWKWGEAYFAGKLFDYELSSNNGNWQWAAGTGCDAAPYFRIFNPEEQLKKFDPELKYVNKWIPELDTPEYPVPMVEHKEARARALQKYKEGINLN